MNDKLLIIICMSPLLKGFFKHYLIIILLIDSPFYYDVITKNTFGTKSICLNFSIFALISFSTLIKLHKNLLKISIDPVNQKKKLGSEK